MEFLIGCITGFVVAHFIRFSITKTVIEDDEVEESNPPKPIYFEFFNDEYFAYDVDHLFLGQSPVLKDLVNDLVARFTLIVAISTDERVKPELLALHRSS